jgi:predicted amidohydrolase
VKIVAAAIQMSAEVLNVTSNLGRADALLQQAREGGADLAVLPELFNTGYGLCPDFAPYAEGPEGPTLEHLRRRSRQWRMSIAAGFVEREGRHLYDSLAFVTPEGETHIYRKRNLVFWERFRFRPGREPMVVATRWGRIGFAICADMIYRKVWRDFADRDTGRKHWLFGHVGPLSGAIPAKVAVDLGIPVVFANQCGPTQTMIPVLNTRIADRFAGLSTISDGRHGVTARAGVDEEILFSSLTIHPQTGLKSWRSTSHLAPAASFSKSEHC